MTGSPDQDKPPAGPGRPAAGGSAEGGRAEGGSPEGGRHVHGPRSVGAVLPGVLRPAFKRRSPAAVRIMSDWSMIVGPVLAAAAAPRRLTSGTLVLACSGPMALELQHLSDQLAARINTYLGTSAVQRIRLVREVLPEPAPIRAPAAPDPAIARAASVAVASVAPGPLRDSLLRLGQRVLGRPS